MRTWDAINAWLQTAYMVGAAIDWALYLAPGVAVTVAARCGYCAWQGWRDRRADARAWLVAAQDEAAPAVTAQPPRIDTRPGTDQAALHTCNAIAAARKETP
ncbi:hypothetical protein [Streptomyces sp. 4R-3d]|uniref:hypothetical protein n=1 Tax=Streptomyces sp. 4R-3d TaxID=2559605 RepID=UPI0010718625|nr:hypothetical protein [Streptomyces sp. 4R-3d]TFI30100.1 hypothetical protein E4P36_04950 [Streptomyces sp. 4R-3d]